MSLKTSPRVISKEKALNERNEENGSKLDDNYLLKRKIVWPENTMKPKPQPKKEAKVVDWLKQ